MTQIIKQLTSNNNNNHDNTNYIHTPNEFRFRILTSAIVILCIHSE